MKILIIRFSSIGDIVLTTPVVRCLKKQLPESEVHYATKKEYAGVLAGNPYIHKLHLLDNDMRSLANILKKEKFDHVIDLHNNLRTFRLRLSIGGKWSRFSKENIRKWIWVNLKRNYMPKTHIVNRYMDTVAHLGVKYDGVGLDFFVSENEKEKATQLISASSHEQYVCLVPGAKFATKTIPVDKCVEIVERLHLPVFILGGKSETGIGSEIVSRSGKENIINYCGKLSLGESAAVLQKAAAVITADTGLMHIAAAFDRNIVSVWGNTSPELGMYPFLPAHGHGHTYIHEVNDLTCRPCSKIGFAQCPKGHFDCMRKQNAEAIATDASN